MPELLATGNVSSIAVSLRGHASWGGGTVFMNLCYEIGSRLYRRRARKGSGGGERERSRESYWHWQFDSSGPYFSKCMDLLKQIKGKDVLEIGCGLGGRTAYLATQGPKSIIGIDINHPEIDEGTAMADKLMPSEHRQRLTLMKTEEKPPADLGPFDVVLLVDSLEHFRDPVAMLDMACSLIKPGGLCYFSTMGWYHHRGSHVVSIVGIPFVNLFFSDKTILDAIRRIVSAPFYHPTMWDSDPPAARWEGIDDLSDRPGEYLNKITVRKTRQAMKDSRFGAGQLEVAGFSFSRFPALRVLNFLARVPVVQEVWHSAIFGRLVRNG